jgi:G:T-mismatch repair DNA endonuclease (very short patch repair protein)
VCTRIRPRANDVKVALNEYCQYAKISPKTRDNFAGVGIEDLISLEKCFNIRVTVLSLLRNGLSRVIWTSNQREGTELFLDLQGSHFSYIKNVDAYAKSFVCPTCDSCFSRCGNFKRHRCDPENVTALFFDGGVFKPPETVFDKMRILTGVDVSKDSDLHYYPYFITYDIECYLPKDNLPIKTDTMMFTARHELMSISTCSNIPGYLKPICFVSNGNSDECIQRFVEYIRVVAAKSYKIVRNNFSRIIRAIEEKISQRREVESEFEDARFSSPRHYARRADFEGILEKLEDFMRVVPVLGFNSQNYDINVMKGPLLRYLQEMDDEDFKFVVKKTNKMTCIQSTTFKFLDVCNFIAPGFSYAKYLKAFKCTLEKGFFPYEWLDSLEKLTERSLPSKDSFYSSLKDASISDEEYALCQEVWKREDMKTMRDFLVWYNNLDVLPFVEAVEKQKEVYRTKHIDMLKDAISLPGLAVRWMMKLSPVPLQPTSIQNPDMSFNDISQALRACQPIGLFNEFNKDIFHTIKENIVGGPSIVFHRYHESKKTLIRENSMGENARPCELVLGVDANALYLWSMMQDMPTGNARKRLPENDFGYKHVQGNSKVAHGWLQYQGWILGIQIQHSQNEKEFRVGQHSIPVDGYCPSTNTVFQFHGCYWHGHKCHKTRDVDMKEHPSKKQTFVEILASTLKKEEYIQKLGYNLIRIWECEWEREVNSSGEIKSFLKSFFNSYYPSTRKILDEKIMIGKILSGEYYGFVECDISVPEDQREKFSEMCPIFKNVELTRDHLSPSMREFAETEGFLVHPQRSLVGSMFGEKVLLLSTLAKWYLEHGLIITKIYQLIEYTPRRVFKGFGDSVSDARRLGDIDPEQELIALTNKLIGNASYGKTITEKTRHRRVKYVDGDVETSLAIRGNKFVSLEEIDDQFYELMMHKTSVSNNNNKQRNSIVLFCSFLYIADLLLSLSSQRCMSSTNLNNVILSFDFVRFYIALSLLLILCWQCTSRQT